MNPTNSMVSKQRKTKEIFWKLLTCSLSPASLRSLHHSPKNQYQRVFLNGSKNFRPESRFDFWWLFFWKLWSLKRNLESQKLEQTTNRRKQRWATAKVRLYKFRINFLDFTSAKKCKSRNFNKKTKLWFLY